MEEVIQAACVVLGAGAFGYVLATINIRKSIEDSIVIRIEGLRAEARDRIAEARDRIAASRCAHELQDLLHEVNPDYVEDDDIGPPADEV